MMSSAVPSVYPVDEELMKLCMLDKLLNLGLAEHFAEEIKETLAQIHRYIKLTLSCDLNACECPEQSYLIQFQGVENKIGA